MNLGVVVVRWRGGAEVERCLESAIRHLDAARTRIVLVDSGSGDGGAEALAARFPEIDVLALDENRSFAHAAGEGARACPADALLLLNPDAEILPGSAEPLIRCLERNPAAAGVVPLLENPDGSLQSAWQLRRLPRPFDLALGRPGRAIIDHARPADGQCVPQPAAAAWLVRRDAWDRLGGLDATFAPAWWEDVDFCARLKSGLETPDFGFASGFLVVPGARVLHHGGSSLAKLHEVRFSEIFYRNLMRYARRHHPQEASRIRALLRFTLALRAVVRPGSRPACRAAVRAVRS